MKKLLALCCLLLGLAPSAHAAGEAPVDIIKETYRQVLEVLKQDNGKNSKQIRQQTEALTMPMFDFPRMTALAVGLGWRKANAEQRAELIHQFQTLLARTYFVTMTRFKNTQIDIKTHLLISNSDRDATVRSLVCLPGTPTPVAVEYSLSKGIQGWKIYNVSVEGASLVTVYRNSFNEEVRKSGVDGLIKLLQNKNSTPVTEANVAKATS